MFGGSTCVHVCKLDKKETVAGKLMCVVVQSLVLCSGLILLLYARFDWLRSFGYTDWLVSCSRQKTKCNLISVGKLIWKKKSR